MGLSNGIWLVSMSAVPNGSNGGLGTYRTHGCDYNVPWAYLTEEEQKFLDTRLICHENDNGLCKCGDGSAASMCKSIPCAASTCDTSKKCYNNYCTCAAEWIDARNRLDCWCMKGDSLCGA